MKESPQSKNMVNRLVVSDPQAELLNQQFQSVSGNGRQFTAGKFYQKTGMSNATFPDIVSS